MQRIQRTPTSVILLGLCTAILQIGGLTAAASAHLGEDTATVELAGPTDDGLPTRNPRTAPTTEAPATTTTVAPPPPAPAPPPPAHRAAPPAPAPAPAPSAPPPPPPVSPQQRVESAFTSAVPAAWRSAITVRLEIIDGSTSWAYGDGLIQVGTSHAKGSEARLLATLAHEFGHLIAFRYGSQAYNGAAPEGWPAYSNRPEEAWADCVSQVFTGVVDPSHGLPPCSGESLSWTASWLGQGPGAR